MADKFDLNVIRIGLEHATFKDFRIRDSISAFIKSVELDLEEIGFEPSDNTKEVSEQLEEIISEIEAPRLVKKSPLELDETEVEVVEKHVEEDEVSGPPVINVDEELEEYDG